MPKPYNFRDRHSRKAQLQGFRARSVYKLQELNNKFRLLRAGMKVLDIGASPGSWLQFIGSQVGLEGKAIGVDIKPIEKLPSNIETHQLDIFDTEALEAVLPDKLDLIVSDVAPNTTGIPGVDQSRSIELNQRVLAIAQKHLKHQGNVVMKVFMGEDFLPFVESLRPLFSTVITTKPSASRDRSKEMYIVCLAKR